MRILVLTAVLLGCSSRSPSPPPEPEPQVGDRITEDEADELGLPVRTAEDAPSHEQIMRRIRSGARLASEGVPTLPSLPVIEPESACHFRTRDEILNRALALFAVASHAAGNDAAQVAAFERNYEVSSHYTPTERAFLAGPRPEHARLQFTWRFEAARVLFWALGIIEELPSPGAAMRAEELAQLILPHTLEELRTQATVRPHSEILDWADLIYRYAWASTEQQLGHLQLPDTANPDVIMEWHPALNWLIGYRDAAWDDVPTDT